MIRTAWSSFLLRVKIGAWKWRGPFAGVIFQESLLFAPQRRTLKWGIISWPGPSFCTVGDCETFTSDDPSASRLYSFIHGLSPFALVRTCYAEFEVGLSDLLPSYSVGSIWQSARRSSRCYGTWPQFWGVFWSRPWSKAFGLDRCRCNTESSCTKVLENAYPQRNRLTYFCWISSSNPSSSQDSSSINSKGISLVSHPFNLCSREPRSSSWAVPLFGWSLC